MNFKYAILGAGRQGVAAAYDMGRFGDAREILLCDVNPQTAHTAADRINRLLDKPLARGLVLDVRDAERLETILTGVDSTLSAVPYMFNLPVTQAALKAGSNLCDLGGHTETVRHQLALDAEARKSGVTITPDCGMGPGLNINLGVRAMDYMDEAEEVRMWDGGLPRHPTPPWNYHLLFHINGLTNEYFGDAWFLRDGQVTPVPCLTEVEELEFSEPLGRLEAAVTSGGLSTAPWSLQDRLRVLENKTLRYPGHWAQFQAYQRLGLFELDPVQIDGQRVVPREVFHALLEPKLKSDDVEDICVIRVQCTGRSGGRKSICTLELIETYDPETGFTAMEKFTGWHASIIAILAARGKLPKGGVPVESALTGELFDAEITKRGWTVQKKVIVASS